VIAAPAFTAYYNCSCRGLPTGTLVVLDGGAQCVAPPGDEGRQLGLVIGIIISSTLPWLLVAGGVYICVA
jgi:hypothetical protein